jgi:methionyl aminopeptidase
VSRLRSNEPCWCHSGAKLKRCHGNHAAVRRRPVEPGRVGPLRTVPDGIQRPSYVDTGIVVPAGPQIVRSADELVALRRACRVAAEVLAETGSHVAAGVTTDELDDIAHRAYLRRGAYPSTLHFHGYRKSICTSVNDVVCHGIPDDRPLEDGDIVNVDVTAYVDGFHGDTSATFAVGALDPQTRALVDTTAEATMAGIEAVRPGLPIRAIGAAVQRVADARGFGIISDYGGHGIGRHFHAAPHIGHTDDPAATTRMVEGMVFTVEPMLTAGSQHHRRWADGWTEATVDGLPSAQFEHTVIVTADGAEVLTRC